MALMEDGRDVAAARETAPDQKLRSGQRNQWGRKQFPHGRTR